MTASHAIGGLAPGDTASVQPAAYVSKFEISAIGDTVLINLFGLSRASSEEGIRFPLAFAGVLSAKLADELAPALNQFAMTRQTSAADPAHPQ